MCASSDRPHPLARMPQQPEHAMRDTRASHVAIMMTKGHIRDRFFNGSLTPHPSSVAATHTTATRTERQGLTRRATITPEL